MTAKDGLPEWKTTPEGFECEDDPQASILAFYFSLFGFDLPEFDLWLSALEPCGAKTELLERRALAVAAALAKKEDGLLRHLEWMLRRKRELVRLDVLVPLALYGKKFKPKGRGVGLVKKLVIRVLPQADRDKKATALEVWRQCKAKKPKSTEFIEPDGKPDHIWTTTGIVSFIRFGKIISEARKALRKGASEA